MSDNTNTQQSEMLYELAQDYLRERRRKRRWGLFFKLAIFAAIGMFFYSSY